MPSAMTYDSLVADLQAYIERGDSNDTIVYDQIPRIINLAERAIATDLKIIGFLNVVTTTLSQGVSVYSKPDRWRQTVSMNFGVGASNNVRTPLFPRAYEYCRAYWPDSTEEDVPQFYSDYDYNHWLVVPTPDADYPVEILYYEQPAYLDSTNQTNWFTIYQPDLLLHRSLMECMIFLKQFDALAPYQASYDKMLTSVNVQDLQKSVDRAVTRRGA